MVSALTTYFVDARNHGCFFFTTMSGSSYLGSENRRLEEDDIIVSCVPNLTRLTEYYVGQISRLRDKMFRHRVLILRPTRRSSGEPTCKLVGSASLLNSVLEVFTGTPSTY